MLLASRDDPYCEFERARLFAYAWGAQFMDYGECGHINADSGLASWPEGHVLLQDLDERISDPWSPRNPRASAAASKPCSVRRRSESAAADLSMSSPGLPASLLLADMVPGAYQPRTRMDEGALYELAESIKAQGIMQPILVRRLDAERRATRAASTRSSPASAAIRAARLAGLDSVPVLVRDVPDEAAAAMSLIENIQREDLNPLEEAHGLQRLVKEFGLTHEQAAQAVGRSRSAASNLLRLLNLADPVQTMLMAGDIDMGHARALLALERAAQITAANQIAAKKLSVREAESLVKKLGAEFNLTSPKPKKEKSRDLRRVEEELSDLLTARGRGAREEARQAQRPQRGTGRSGDPVRIAGRTERADRPPAWVEPHFETRSVFKLKISSPGS